MPDSLKKYSSVFVIIVLVTAILVLVGWQFGIEIFKRPLSNLVAMNPMTAVAFAFSSGSLLLLNKQRKTRYILAGKILALLVLMIGTAKLTGIIIGYDSGIDLWLYYGKLSGEITKHVLNSMAPNTAASFILAGLSLLFLNYQKGNHQPAHYSAFVITVISLLSILGYIYQVPEFHGVLKSFPMAVHSAFVFCFFHWLFYLFILKKGS